MFAFRAQIAIIGVNPYVFVTEEVLHAICEQAGKDKGHIPIKGTIDGHDFIHTLVKYAGHWRLYLNLTMRQASMTKVGDFVTISIAFDPLERKEPIHPKLEEALHADLEAKAIFEKLCPSHQKEVARYINQLKSETAIERNVSKAIDYLYGKARFIGRDNPK